MNSPEKSLDEQIAEVEKKIEELKKALPAHSLKIPQARELDDLEYELYLLKKKKEEKKD